MTLPKIPVMPKAAMQGTIALLLLVDFTFLLIAPSVWTAYKEPSTVMSQTLVNLVILAVGYYLGSSQGSARKDELNAMQQDKTITALAPAAALAAEAPDPGPEVVIKPPVTIIAGTAKADGSAP